jgi:SAM-dependent methyltransferase
VPPRIVQPELLDSLPPGHPEARHNRRDLRLTNIFMGNHRWLARVLQAHVRPSERILELGAGTGELATRLRRQGWPVDGLDTCPAPDAWPASARWHRVDLRNFDGYDAYGVVYGNLIFHQFTATELGALGARLQTRSRLLLACEPARRRRSQWLFRTLSPFFGASRISRHDARVSIAAGFLGDELSRLLRLDAGRWAWRCTTTPLGAYRMIAWRCDTKRIPA